MIELGKYGTDFIVSKSDIEVKATQGFLEAVVLNHISTNNWVTYKGFDCRVKNIYDDSVVLQLITNNPSDFIPIVV